MLEATKQQAIRQLRKRVTDGGRSPVRTRRLRVIWLLVPLETTSPAAALTALKMDPPPPTSHPSDYPYRSANAAPTPTPTMVDRVHPCDNNRGQPKTTDNNLEKTPGAPRTLVDEPIDFLQGRGGEAADSSISPTAGTRTNGYKPRSTTL